MGSSSKRSAKQSARATPAAARTRVRAPIRASGRSSPKPAKKTVPRRTRRPRRPRRAPAPFPLRAVLEQLEPRLLMSADLAPFAADALFAAPTSPGGAEFRSLTDADRSSAVITDSVAPIQRTHEVVFVDPRVPDRDQLIAGLAGQTLPTVAASRSSSSIPRATGSRRSRRRSPIASRSTRSTSSPTAPTARCSSAGTWLDAKTVGGQCGSDRRLGQRAEGGRRPPLLRLRSRGDGTRPRARRLARGAHQGRRRGEHRRDRQRARRRRLGARSARAGRSRPRSRSAPRRARAGRTRSAPWRWAPSRAPIRPPANAQDQAAVATAPDGRFVVAWVSNGQDGDGRGVFARALRRERRAADQREILVNTTTAEQPVRAHGRDGPDRQLRRRLERQRNGRRHRRLRPALRRGRHTVGARSSASTPR